MFKNSNLHAYEKTTHTHTLTLTNVPHKEHMHNCHDLHNIKFKKRLQQITWKWHHMENILTKDKNTTKLTSHCPTVFENRKGSSNHAHIIIGLSFYFLKDL